MWASALRQAVSGLDSMLGAGSEADMGDGVLSVATEIPRLPEASTVTH
jgi:hypothetical protein